MKRSPALVCVVCLASVTASCKKPTEVEKDASRATPSAAVLPPPEFATASPVGTTPIGLVHAATSVPNHIVTELQDLTPPVGLTVDVRIDDGGYVLGDSPGLGIRVDEVAIAAVSANTVLSSVDASHGPHVRPEHAGRRLVSQPVRGRAD